ncbi:glutaminase [Chromobacterium alticapitis]|uniref:Glutaminase n=1 Tax=Chromobacterium alticapitis TaxID=2073169 RepID=A0A2S5DDJ1_9NEIS|nr:glutaminase [Chromobacterium alticapitis]POZ61180.1 glutaminase [Chromobacterium alticapitis]
MNLQALIEDIRQQVLPFYDQGQVADYIPALAAVPPRQFAFAIHTLDGEQYACGDADTPFSMQSISKAFMLALTLQADGEQLWRHVGKEPSGNPFNSLVQLEYEHGIPRNPFINAGALAVTDRAIGHFGDAHARLLSWLRSETGNAALTADEAIASSERAHGDRNAALAHFMKSYGNIQHEVGDVLDQYFHNCSIALNCRELARAGLFLANHGVSTLTGERYLSRSQAKQVNAVMLTCGTYDAAGEFAYRVGLPVKSGVGGGLLAVIPGKMSIAVWSPQLDTRGNSVLGLEALDRFSTATGLSIF